MDMDGIVTMSKISKIIFSQVEILLSALKTHIYLSEK